MATELRKISVKPDSEVGRLLDEAAKAPVLLEKEGVLFRLEAEEPEDIWAGYDPKKVVAAVNKTAGAWSDIDADAAIAKLYRAREEGSRPARRP